MSWYSDGDPFDEYDPPWCRGCKGGHSYAECKRCCEYHLAEEKANERYRLEQDGYFTDDEQEEIDE